jgi:CubicO group peptidase (beta-lactamase class C family)
MRIGFFSAFLLIPQIAWADFSERLGQYTRLRGPGVALLVIKDGKVVRKEGFGFADLSRGTRISPETNFNLASNSKQFTATAALLLERQKKISLTDPLSKYIPEIPEYAGKVKISDLIHHTAGLPDYLGICDSKDPVTNKEVIAFLRKRSALDFPPGTRHEYSNTGYVILSEVIERAAGVPFFEFVQEAIFNKLGMKNSFVLRSDGADKGSKRAIGYSEWPFFKPLNSSPCDRVYGDGGVLTNLEDYSRWLLALNGPGFLSEGELQRAFSPSFLEDGTVIPYSFGWMNDEYRGSKYLYHTGAWLGFRSFVVHVPSKKLWVSILSNHKAVPGWDLMKEIAFSEKE